MTVFGHSTGGGFRGGGRQVFPLDEEAEVSRRLLEASLLNDLTSASECLADPSVHVNYVGAVCLKLRKTELLLREQLPCELRVDFEELRTDVPALFLAVHNGNVPLVKKLLSVGADINQKVFKGYALTAAVREGNLEMSEILLRAGASQPACEEALLEASCHGHSKIAERLMASDLIRPQIAVQALVTACCRGYEDLISVLVKCGVDVNANTRQLLQSKKPPLHVNVDCVPLVAAVVSRQVSAVRQLLEAGAKTDIKVQLGAWSWDKVSGEESRVGAGLAEPYPIPWCAVEYFEATGSILYMLLQHDVLPLDTTHLGRTILHHAVLCGNTSAVKMILKCGADVETVVETTNKAKYHPIHIAARLGLSAVLQCLIESGCDVNSTTKLGETALMLSAKYRREECLKVLAKAGADFGLVNLAGESVLVKADLWHLGFQEAMMDVIRNGIVPKSSSLLIFSPLMFVAQVGDVHALRSVIAQGSINLDAQDGRGISALMITAMEGHVEAFRLLVYAGADLKLRNTSGETAIFLSQINEKREQFEKVMLEFAIERGNCIFAEGYPFHVLHFAARQGELDAVKLLISRGYTNINSPDANGYTPLMLAAKEGHAPVCQHLIASGAQCKLKNVDGETALSLARKVGSISTENAILDGLARELVLGGMRVLKHTKGGKGLPHMKVLKMERGPAGVVLRWGNSKRRNVVCLEAVLGPSSSFQMIRKKKGDHVVEDSGLFRVRTKNKEIHFACEGGVEMAELWVRGIKLVTTGWANFG